MEINELELEEDMIKVESSPESNYSSGISQNHNNTDAITTSIDHDPGATYTSACSSSLIISEDLHQDEVQSGIIESSQSKLEDDKIEDDIALGTSAMASPTEQVMEKDEDTEPYRISSSVFNRSDSSAPAEWSAASNDSLFSLHGGFSSSKDQSPLLREESDKSRSVSIIEDDGKEKEAERKELVIDKTKENGDELAKRSSISCRSDASDGSTFSFAFPILASGRVQTSSIREGDSSPNTTHSMEPHSQPQPQPQPDNDSSTPPKPQSTSKEGFFSCFSNCCSLCCCSSCWPFKS